MLEYYMKTGKRFVLLRRYSEEIDKTHTELYFNDIVSKELDTITKGKYNGVECIANKIYFVAYNENGKAEKKEHIGYAISLNREQNFSSILSEKDIDNIIFEEFQSRTTYLTNETDKLDFLYSTIDREQGTTRIWFLGNAISKACPYWDKFGILDIVKNQKNATIEIHEIDGKKILLEKTPVFKATKTTIGQSAGAIALGEWYTEKQPRIKMNKNHKRGLLYVNFDFNGLLFLGELNLTENKDPYWFIRSVEFFKDTKKTYTVTNAFKPSKMVGSNIYDLGGERFREIIKKTFVKDKIFFSTHETGTDFNTACTFRIRGG